MVLIWGFVIMLIILSEYRNKPSSIPDGNPSSWIPSGIIAQGKGHTCCLCITSLNCSVTAHVKLLFFSMTPFAEISSVV